MPREDRHVDVDVDADSGESGSSKTNRRREAIESLVDRTLGPAMGMCLRVFDPLGEDPEGREKARMIVMNCIGRCAATDSSADDRATRRVLAKVAEAALDGLVGQPGGTAPPPQVDLDRLAGRAAQAGTLAPSGRLSFAVLLDAVAPARRSDRRVAFMVLAAGMSTSDAAVALGVDPSAVEASLARIARRIAETEGLDTLDAAS